MNRSVSVPRPRQPRGALLAALAVLALAIASTAGAEPYDAEFGNATVPQVIRQGESPEIIISMRNTGQFPWQGGWAVCELDYPGWGIGCIDLDPVYSVGPGGTFDFRATLRGLTEGVYKTRWQMFSGVAVGKPSGELTLVVSGGDDAVPGSSAAASYTMRPGEIVPVGVVMTNVGTTTWTIEDYELGSVSPTDWGVSRVPLGKSVAPWESVRFDFDVKAPAERQACVLQWRMVHKGVRWFGQSTAPFPITIEGDPATNDDAVYFYWRPYGRQPANTAVPLEIEMINTGKTTWTSAAGYHLHVESQDVTILDDHGGFPATDVEPDSLASFPVTIKTPPYQTHDLGEPIRVQMYHGDQPFGSPGTIYITLDKTIFSDVDYPSQTVPAVLTAGEAAEASLTLLNTGPDSWAAGGYQLVSRNSNWGTTSVALQGSVASGGQTTVTIPLTAPATPGAYGFQWQLLHDGQPLGAPSPNRSIPVVASSVFKPGYYEQTATRLHYTGNWVTWAGEGPSASSMKYTNDPAASVRFEFEGTGLRVHRLIARNRGPMRVCIDGDDAAHCVDVPNYAYEKVYQAPWTSGPLCAGVHTAKISNTSSQYIDLDAIRVLQPLTAGYYEETNPNISYSTGWLDWSGSGPSGGTVRYSNDPAARASFQFDGSGLVLFRTMQPLRSATRVCIDGDDDSHCATVDNYSETALFRQRWAWTKTVLASGIHSVSISTASTQAIDIDAVRVLPPVVPPKPLTAGYYEETDPNLTYSGTWSDWAGEGPSGGSLRYTSQLGAKVSFQFQGTEIKIYRSRVNNRGPMRVCIDGDDEARCSTVENWSESTAYKRAWSWADPAASCGPHSVTITNTSAAIIDLDAVEVVQ